MRQRFKLALVGTLGALVMLAGCNKLLGLGDYNVTGQAQGPVAGACVKHADCSQNPKFAGADYCSHTTQQCVTLKSKDCTTVTGPANDDNAVLIGSLFATTGDMSAANLARERSAILAVSEINSGGGLPPAKGSDQRRPLALLSCDASNDPIRAAEHMVNDLELPAIIGPNNSQNTLDVAMQVSIRAGTLTISPQAVVGSIAELIDDDLVWQMVPSDVQRGPLMVHELAAMERDLRTARGRKELKLSIIVRGDALGTGTRASLNGMRWNDKSLADAISFGTAKIDTYQTNLSTQPDLVAAHAAFAADLIVLVGSGEAVNEIMTPLEQSWGSGARPEYILIDSSKVPDLLSLVNKRPELANRLRGTGNTPGPQSIPINQDFLINYTTHYPDSDEATSAGVGPSYDATYAVAYGIVAADGDVTGPNIARGLRRLSGGEVVPLGPTHILSAMRHLENGEPISGIGTYSALVWDDRGALSSGAVEIWCVRMFDNKAVFQSSGITADVPSQALHGQNTVCPVQVPNDRTATSQPAVSGDAGVAQAPSPTKAPDAGAPTPSSKPDGGSDAGESSQHDAGDSTRDAGMPVSAAAPGPVPCVTTQCDRTHSQYCCVSLQHSDGTFGNDFSCQTQASCRLTLRCTSDRECGGGAICCGDQRSQSYCIAATSCSQDEVHLGCDKPSDCAKGKVCCAHGNSQNGAFETECEDSCESDDNEPAARVCDAQSQCARPQTCVRSESLPTIGLCR